MWQTATAGVIHKIMTRLHRVFLLGSFCTLTLNPSSDIAGREPCVGTPSSAFLSRRRV
jgi:hypothetical protein